MRIKKKSYFKERIAILISFVLLLTAFTVTNAHKSISKNKSKNQFSELSIGAQTLIKTGFEGMDSTQLMDYHVHVFGTGTGLTLRTE